jgi:hypothetical protein
MHQWSAARPRGPKRTETLVAALNWGLDHRAKLCVPHLHSFDSVLHRISVVAHASIVQERRSSWAPSASDVHADVT